MLEDLDRIFDTRAPTASLVKSRAHFRKLPSRWKGLPLIKNLHDALGRRVPNAVRCAAHCYAINDERQGGSYRGCQIRIAGGKFIGRKISDEFAERAQSEGLARREQVPPRRDA